MRLDLCESYKLRRIQNPALRDAVEAYWIVYKGGELNDYAKELLERAGAYGVTRKFAIMAWFASLAVGLWFGVLSIVYSLWDDLSLCKHKILHRLNWPHWYTDRRENHRKELDYLFVLAKVLGSAYIWRE